MLSFKQFIDEKWIDYKSRPTIRGANMGTSQYDDEYYDKIPDTDYRDNSGKLFGGVIHKLIPKKATTKAEEIIPTSDDVIHRGISHEEYQEILKYGRIKSKGRDNFSDSGLTYFSTNPATAAIYAATPSNPNLRPTPKKPAYIISIKKPHQSKLVKGDGMDDYVGVVGDIPANDIIAVHRGNVTTFNKGENQTYYNPTINPNSRNSITKTDYYKTKRLHRQPSQSISDLSWEKIK